MFCVELITNQGPNQDHFLTDDWLRYKERENFRRYSNKGLFYKMQCECCGFCSTIGNKANVRSLTLGLVK